MDGGFHVLNAIIVAAILPDDDNKILQRILYGPTGIVHAEHNLL